MYKTNHTKCAPTLPHDTNKNQTKIIICIICAQYVRQMSKAYVMIVHRDFNSYHVYQCKDVISFDAS